MTPDDSGLTEARHSGEISHARLQLKDNLDYYLLAQ